MKKIISFILTVTMMLTAVSVFAADVSQKDYPQKFWDVPKDHWAFNYIAELVNKGVLAGYEDGSFKPDATVTRAEWAKIMVLAAGLPTSDNNVYFTDMQNHWANIYVNTAKNYLAAYTDGTFKPDQAAVREDVTVSLVKLKGYDINSVDYSYLSQFKDTNSISNSLKAYVAVAIQNNLISGFDDNTFRGQDTLTRAEAATLLWKAFQSGSNNKVVDTPNTPVSNTTSTVTPEPTEKPKETNTDKEEQKNNNEQIEESAPTEEPAPEPDPEPEPEIEVKPYKVDTIVKANVSSPLLHAKYNNDIYYAENNSIFKVNIDTHEKETIIESDDFTIDNEKMTLSNFKITSIAYDSCNDRILATGNYGVVNPSNTIQNPVLLEIKNNSANILTEEWDECLAGVISNGDIVNMYGYTYDSESFKAKSNIVPYKFWIGDNSSIYMNDYLIIGLVEMGNDIYSLGGLGRQVSKYDYSSAEAVVNIDDTCVGIYDNIVIGMSNSSINLYNFNGKKINSIKASDVEVLDKQPLYIDKDKIAIYKEGVSGKYAIYHRLYMTSNENIIFYDTTSKAFRMISENK
ncbi:MAG: S-layer homology domain-containing protein [Clostridia bacterium]|nr:S-layer homology domain-containing protein [Clostridia bacterium]